jgi:sulfur relay (sulfurtransferase) complex TusBCD TusD component (DsrE family)
LAAALQTEADAIGRQAKRFNATALPLLLEAHAALALSLAESEQPQVERSTPFLHSEGVQKANNQRGPSEDSEALSIPSDSTECYSQVSYGQEAAGASDTSNRPKEGLGRYSPRSPGEGRAGEGQAPEKQDRRDRFSESCENCPLRRGVAKTEQAINALQWRLKSTTQQLNYILAAVAVEQNSSNKEVASWVPLRTVLKNQVGVRKQYFIVRDLMEKYAANEKISPELRRQLYDTYEGILEMVRLSKVSLEAIHSLSRIDWMVGVFRHPRETYRLAIIKRYIERHLGEIIAEVTDEDRANLDRWHKLVERNPAFADSSKISSENYDRSKGVRVDWETFRAKTSG